jgi:hypothetical protein
MSIIWNQLERSKVSCEESFGYAPILSGLAPPSLDLIMEVKHASFQFKREGRNKNRKLSL